MNVKAGRRSLSWTGAGVLIPCEERPSEVFKRLFLVGSPEEIRKQIRQLELGRSIMDAVGEPPMLEICGNDGVTNSVQNPPARQDHVDVRVVIDAGDTGGTLALPESQLLFTSGVGVDHTIYLPAVSLPQYERAYFWVSTNGSTFFGDSLDTEPDFSMLARGAPVPWDVGRPGYKVEVVGTGYQLPVVAEVGFEARYRLTPCLALRMAYDFMWVSGLALAPEQIKFTTIQEPKVNDGGAILIQGLTAGCELTW